MAVIFKDKTMFEGAVLKIDEHYWLDGMLESWAVCWNSEKQEIENVTFGYYSIEGSNLAGGSAKIDATRETWREVLRSLKPRANKAFADSVIAYKRDIRKGTHAKVVRGRKIPKGTVVDVFWVGEKPTFRGMRYTYLHETETIAGCYDEHGNKLWIKAEYLENIDPIKSPNAKERRKFIKSYIEDRAHELGAPWARRGRT